MPTKKHIRPNEKLPLKLTAAERNLVLEGLTCLDQEIQQIVRDAPSGQPVRTASRASTRAVGVVGQLNSRCSLRRRRHDRRRYLSLSFVGLAGKLRLT